MKTPQSAVLLVCLLTAGRAAAADYRQPGGDFGSGGGSGASTSFSGTSAAGQGTGSGVSASENYRNHAGFVNASEDGSAPPRVTEVSSASLDGLYGPGSAIELAVSFTEPVTSAGLKIGLNSGGSVSTGPLAGVTRWRGTYVVGPGEAADRLAAGAIAGAITDASGRTTVDPAVPTRRNFAAAGGIAVDAAGPAVEISPPSTPGGEAGPVEYTVTYTDANFLASRLAASDIALNGTGSATGTVEVTGTGDTRTVTISDMAGDGTLGISLAEGTAVDLVGNRAPAAGPSASFEVDNTPPAVLVVTSGNVHGHYPAGSPIAITVSFSEGVSSTGLTVELNSGATVSTGPFGPATSWSGTSPVGAGQSSADLSVEAIRGTITDGRGHATLDPAVPAGRNLADARAIVIDTTAPAVAIGAPSAAATRVGPVAYPVTYTDANFAASTLAEADITLDRTGTADGVVGVSGTGAARKVTVGGISGSGTLGISIAAGTATDGAGNKAPAAGPSAAFQVDGTAPSVTSVTSTTAQGHYKAGGVINVTVDFSEPVYSAGVAINLNSGGSVTTGALNGVARYSGDYRVAAGQQAGSLSVATITGKITDALGNAVVDPIVPAGRNIADGISIVVDTLAPGAAIGAPSPALTRSGPVTYTVTYDDPFFTASTLTVGDIRLNRTGTANGTVAVAGTGNTWTVTVDGITGDGTLSISLAAGTATDLAGNAAAALTGEPVLVDTAPPRVTRAVSPAVDGHYGAGGEIVVTVNFSEAVFSPGLTVTLNSGGSVFTGALAGVASWSATHVVGAGQTAADLSIVAIAGTITDRVGNASTDPRVPAGKNIADGKAIVVDTTAPGVAIGAPSAAATRVGPVTYTVRYADENFGRSTLASADVTLHRTGTADGTVVVAGTRGARTVEIRNVRGDGTLGISVAAGTATDRAGNRAPAAGPAAAFLVDNTPPEVTGVTSATADGFYKAGSAIDVTVHFSTAVSSTGLSLKFDTGGVVNTGPFKDVTSFSVVSTVAAGQTSADLNVVSITGTIADALGNKLVNPTVSAGKNVADGKSIVVDTTAPSVSIGAPSVPVTRTTPVTYAVTWADTNLKSGSLGPEQVTLVRTGNADGAVAVAGSGSAWAVTITPTAGSGTLAISIAAGTAADQAGNSAPATGPGIPVQVDVTPPAVARATSTTENGDYRAGSLIDVTLSFSEPVSSPGLTIGLDSGGTAGTGALSGVTTCSAVFRVEDGQTSPDLSVRSIKGSISDAVTNVTVDPEIPAGKNIADGKAIVVDTTAPTVAIGAPSSAAVGTGPASYRVTYADTNFGASTLAADDVTLKTTGSAAGKVGVTGAAAARTVTISNVTGDGTLGIELAAGTAVDAAGNRAPAAGPSATFVADNTPPAVTGAGSTTADGRYKAGGAVTVTVAFSEPVWSPGLTITLNSGGTVRTGALDGVVSHSGTFTVGAGQNSADLGISGIAGTISDAAGNTTADPKVPAGRNISDTANIRIDTTAPTVAIGASSVSATKAGPVTYPVTYADDDLRSGTLGVGDITLIRTGTANGTVGVSGAAASWTVTITATTGTGTLGIALAAATAADFAGNAAPAAGPSATFAVDNTPPVVTGATSAAADGHYKAGSPIDVTLRFSEPVSSPNLTATLNSGGKVIFEPFNGAMSCRGSYAVGDGETTSDLSVVAIAGAIVDGVANAAVDPAVPAGKNIADAREIVVDTTAPAVTIGGPSAAVTKAGPVSYTVSYTDQNFRSSTLAAADVALVRTGTAAGKLAVTGAGRTRTVTIGGATGDGTLSLLLAAGTARDKAGNFAPAAGPSATVQVDNTPPMVNSASSKTANGHYGANSGIDVTVDFDTAVSTTGLTIALSSGGTVNTGPLNSVTSWSGISTVEAGQTAADVSVETISGTIKDTAGNTLVNPTIAAGRNIADAKAIVIDTTAPAVMIGPPSVASTRAGPVTFALTCADANLDRCTVSAGDITLNRTGSAAGTVGVTGTGTTRTATISDTSGDGTLGIAVAAAAAVDLAGNRAPGAGPSTAFQVDNTPPAVANATSTTADGHYKADDVIDVTVNFDEAVSSTGLTIALNSGVSVSTGAFSGATSCRGRYTVAAGQTAANLSIIAIGGRITDASANETVDPLVPAGKNLADAKAIVIDTTAPTLEIGPPTAPVIKAGPVAYTVTYADENFGAGTLAAGDVALNRTGSAAGTVGVTGRGATRTVTISGASGDGTLSIALAAGTAKDKAGNPAPAAGPSAAVTVDNALPAVTVAASVASAAEAGSTAGQFTVARAGSTNFDLVVNYAITGTAVAGDYAPLAGSVTIPAGATTQTITVTPVDDTAVEGDETVVATLKASAAYLVGTPASATVTIRSDDGLYAPAVGAVAPLPLTTATGRAQTFDAAYSDRDGAANLQRVDFRVYLPSAAGQLTLGYDRTADTVHLYDEGGTATVGSCSPGTAVSLSNALGVVDCAATAVSVSGNELAVRWSIAPGAVGAASVQTRATDVTGKATGWADQGAWTIISTNRAPTVAAVVPAALVSPPHAALTFSAVYADADGSANIRTASLLVNATESVGNGIRLSYDRLANRLYLFDDAGTAALESCTPRENKDLSNAQGVLSCAATTVEASDDTLTVNWNIASTSAFASVTPWNLYLQTVDMSDASTAWTDLADWTVTPTNLPPAPESVTPAISTSAFDTAQTFSAVYGDPDGFANLRTVSLLANAGPTAVGGILVRYDRTVNRLFIFDDSGKSALESCAPGEARSIPAPRQQQPASPGSLDCALTTVDDSGKDFRVDRSITPRAAFASAPRKNIYLGASDVSGASAAWTDKGDWLLTGETPTTGTVSPAALPGAPDTAQAFTAVYRDPGGYQQLKQVSFLVNTTASAANGIRLSYDGQWLHLYDDAGKDHVGYCRPGEAGSLSNTQGTLDCAATTVSGSGNDLTVTWSITPSAAFASNARKNIYIDPVDPAGAGTGWADAGDWTIEDAVVAPPTSSPSAAGPVRADRGDWTSRTANVAPAPAAVTPEVLTSVYLSARTISAVYSDADGVANVRTASLLLNATPTASGGISLVLDRTENRLSMQNDAGTGTVGSCAPGAQVYFGNSQGQLSCPSTTVAGSGNDLTVNWTITPSPAFASETTPKNLYLSARDMSNASVGWTDRGDWLIKATNAAPTLGGVTPAAAKSLHSVPQAFTAVYQDADGFANLWYADLLVNVSTAVVYSIRVRYDRLANRLYLYGDMGNSYADSCAPGETKSLSNSQGTLNCALTTVAGSGTDLTVTWDITPRATLASAPRELYLDATDMSHQSPGWTSKGAWTVTNGPPTLGSVTHAPLASVPAEAHSLTSSYGDANGAADLKSVKFLVNTAADPRGGIFVQYDSSGELYLYDTTGTAAVGSCKPGQPETLSNAQGSLNCAATTVTVSGNTLAVSWSITPSAAFSSGTPRNLYLSAVDASNASAGFAVKGDWTIKGAAPLAGQTSGGGSGCPWTAPDATRRRACVDTAAALAACLLEAETDGRHDEIRLVQGYYRGSYSFVQEEGYELALVGGYEPKCAGRGLNAALTVLDADLDGDGTGDGRVLTLEARKKPAQLRVERVTMRNGVAAAGDGGCLRLSTGGGAVLDGVEIAGCRAAGAGGAAAVEVGAGAALVRESILRGSSAESGGGLAIRSAGGDVTLINTTISGNSARIGGGVLIEGEPGGALELSNTIVWGNSAGTSGDIDVAGFADPARVKVSGNDFTKMTAPESWPAPDESNINADPGFMTRDDLHLTESSPCRDAGAGPHPLAGSFDIDGDERRIGAAIDIGADEHAAAR